MTDAEAVPVRGTRMYKAFRDLADYIEHVETEWEATRDGNEDPAADFTASAIVDSDWMREHDAQVSEKARREGWNAAIAESVKVAEKISEWHPQLAIRRIRALSVNPEESPVDPE